MSAQQKPIPSPRAKPRCGLAGMAQEEWRNPAYRRFLRRHGVRIMCWQCPQPFQRPANTGLWPVDPAHGPVNGMRSEGPDSGCVPLCQPHYEE